jgi:hypothetical protein
MTCIFPGVGGIAGAYSTPSGGAGAKPAGAQSRGDPGSKLPPLAGAVLVAILGLDFR